MLAVPIKINDSIQVILLSEKCRLKNCYLKKGLQDKSKNELSFDEGLQRKDNCV